MKTPVKILLWIVGACSLIYLTAWIFNVDYLFKAVRVIYLTGHKTAFLEDYNYFDNHSTQLGTPQPWNLDTTHAVAPSLKESLTNYHDSIQSVAYLVIHNDTIVFEDYYHGYDKTSKSNSFSMAKSVVSILLGKSIELGKIKSLEQKVMEFVPEIHGEYATELTLRDLVSMSSGMKWSEDYYSPTSITTQLYFDDNLMNVIRKLPIEKPPGQKFIYQSGDTQLLGIAIQRATGQSLTELLSTYFWEPMGAEQEALWQVDSKDSGIEKAYCCLASNARDFARFGKLYFNHGKWEGQQLIDSTYVQASISPRFDDAPQYGLGWWMGTYQEKPYFYMDGHLGQYVIVIPQDNLIVVRLGHQIGKGKRSDPASDFNKFIHDAYQIIGQQ